MGDKLDKNASNMQFDSCLDVERLERIDGTIGGENACRSNASGFKPCAVIEHAGA
jgi:hypothetical protein